ncbi:O-antigen/teichoic acid export membrane protein [Solibacillus kalamii]|uniref:Uncharacterized protein n=1 Tax=Solibacillus kalamii TaxID=1748298 RepID=A0ABX3ZKX9_9BACL|nr:oligosaccharide flippase family protein [Solibacillus kalamii]MBM7665258.1 O-antigen/teichoic acid export membrane protein [Solibacillus kalamii]OUZ40383.1 hypothetical protein CBM15_00570 [Solibacillus kalamii]
MKNINFRKQLVSNDFLRSFALLASGSVIAQIITILISPIVTRLFTPEQFGLYTIVITAMSLFGPVICLKYDMGIVNAKSEREAFSLILLCGIMIVPLSLLISILYSMTVIRGNYSLLQLWGYIFAIAMLLITYGLNNILLAYNNRHGLYKIMSSVTVIKSLVNNILLVLSGISKLGVIGLLGSQIISSLVGLKRQSKSLLGNIRYGKNIGFIEMKQVFLDYKKLPIFNASSALITTSVYSSINLFIAIAFSAQQLGLYSLSYRVLGIPFTIISANIARVFFNSATKEFNSRSNFSKTFKSTLILLIITVVPIILIIAIFSPWLFSTVFGVEWANAGNYIRLLAPMFAIRLISESLTTSFIVSKKQNIELLFQSMLLLGLLIIYTLSYFLNTSIEVFLVYISLLYLLVHGIMIFKMYKISKMKIN